MLFRSGVESGFVLSSTSRALPVPSCVIRRAALVLSVTLITALALNVAAALIVAVSVEASPRVVLPVLLSPGIVTVVFAASTYTARSDGCVTNTSFAPAVKDTADPALLDDKTVSRLNVLVLLVYVPMPTSHSFVATFAMV